MQPSVCVCVCLSSSPMPLIPWVYLVLPGLDLGIGLHGTVQLQLLQHYWLGHGLRLLWYWMVCLGNEQKSFCHFWDCIQILHFRIFVYHDGYSISSKGFLPTVVDIMVIWVKFTHSSPFSSLIPRTLTFTLATSCLTTPICLDSWTWHSRFLCNIALYSIRPCFYHQSHPQLGIVFALAPSLHSFWSYFSTDLQ